MNVTEDVGDVVLTVRRNQGRVGPVAAVILITGLGATPDQDFIGTNLEVRAYKVSVQLVKRLIQPLLCFNVSNKLLLTKNYIVCMIIHL